MPALGLGWGLVAALTAAGVAADINTRGPRLAVADLVAGGDWNRAMAAIAAGDRDWIALAPRLARATDAGQSAALGLAMARALPVAASDVLAAMAAEHGPVLAVQRVCGGVTAADRDAAREAVSAAPALANPRARTACLKALEAN